MDPVQKSVTCEFQLEGKLKVGGDFFTEVNKKYNIETPTALQVAQKTETSHLNHGFR